MCNYAKYGAKCVVNLQVKAIQLHPDLFSVENGLLTPTLKAKRCDIQKRFQPQIDNMYSKLG